MITWRPGHGTSDMQFRDLEVVIAISIFAGLIAFLALIYSSMRALISQAAHTITVLIQSASNIFHGARSSVSNTAALRPGEKPNAEGKY